VYKRQEYMSTKVRKIKLMRRKENLS